MASLYFDYYSNSIPDDELMELLDTESVDAPVDQLHSAEDSHTDIYDEIEWMREMLLDEVTEGYNHVCGLLSQRPNLIKLRDRKRFLELALKFLTLTRDKRIKWPDKESFDIVRRIKSYILLFRNMKHAKQFVSSKRLSKQKQLSLAKRHNQIYEEFQSLKQEFLPIATLAHRMYSKLALKNRKRYLPLEWNFELCMKFLRISRSDLLLVTKDQFDYFARTIRTLVTGVDPMESVHINSGSADVSRTNYELSPASSNSRVTLGVASVNWQEDLRKEIELTWETDFLEIEEFYHVACEKLETAEVDSEHKGQKRLLELALDVLSLKKDDEIKWSRNQCFQILKYIKLNALRSRNEYLADQSEQQQQLKKGLWTDLINPSLVFASGSRDSTTLNELADWHEDLHREIESAREYLSVIEQQYRRVCIACSQSQEYAAKLSEERLFLESALELLALTRNEKIIRPKALCFRFLETTKRYGMHCRNSINAIQTRDWLKEAKKYVEIEKLREMYLLERDVPQSSESATKLAGEKKLLQIEGNATAGSEPVEVDDWQDLLEEIGWMRETLLAEIEQIYKYVCKTWPESPDLLAEKEKWFLESALQFLITIRDHNIRWSKEDCLKFVKTIKLFALRYRDVNYAQPFRENPSLSESSESSSLRKWPRLADRHNLMYKEFLSLKEKYSHIVTFTFKMYCKFCLKYPQKYFQLVWEFAFCTVFLKLSRSELLLFLQDEFDYYARKIRKMVTGVDSVESLNMNTGSADAPSPTSSNPAVLSERVDWHEYVQRQIELVRNEELPEIDNFYSRVCELCSQSNGADAELEQEKRSIEKLKSFLARNLNMLSQEKFLELVNLVKFYSIRSRNEHLTDNQCKEPQVGSGSQYTQSGGSSDSTVLVGREKLADWDEELLNRIIPTRECLFEYGEALARRCILRFQRPEFAGFAQIERSSLESAFKLLAFIPTDEITTMPRSRCFELLDKIKLYVLRYRKIMYYARGVCAASTSTGM